MSEDEAPPRPESDLVGRALTVLGPVEADTLAQAVDVVLEGHDDPLPTSARTDTTTWSISPGPNGGAIPDRGGGSANPVSSRKTRGETHAVAGG